MDEHLDTSWCPVCDKLILPKRFTVPADVPPTPQPPPPNGNQKPSPIPPSLSRQSSARGKSGGGNAYLRALARNQGGGLLHGTGRIRPGGGLKRTVSSNAVVTSSQPHQKRPLPALHPAMTARERVVIDQAQTPLYCSEECRKADLELANIPLSRSVPSDSLPQVHQALSGLSIHPSQLNSAVASPPPLSPTLPPAPPNSFRATWDIQTQRTGLKLNLSEVDGSDSSWSATGSGTSTGYVTSPEIEQGTQKTLTKPSLDYLKVDGLRNGRGFESVAKQLQKLLISDPNASAKLDSSRDPKDPKKHTMHLPSPTLSTNPSPFPTTPNLNSPLSPTCPSKQARVQSAIELYSKYPLFSKSRSSSRPNSRLGPKLTALPTVSGSYADAYAFTTSASTPATSAVDNQLTASPIEGTDNDSDRDSLIQSTQIPDFLPHTDLRLPPHLAKMYAGKKLSTRHFEPRNILAKGAEGKLLVPNVKLKPIALDTSLGFGSAPTTLADELKNDNRMWMGVSRTVSGGNSAGWAKHNAGAGDRRRGRVEKLQTLTFRRDMSDPGARRECVQSPLESVKEGRLCHHADVNGKGGRRLERQGSESTQDADSEDAGSVTSRERKREKDAMRSSASVSRRSSQKGSEDGRKGREGLKLHERGRLNMQARTWSYDNLDIPTYEPMPAVPLKQIRLEEVFIPDPPSCFDHPQQEIPHRPSSTSFYTHIDISPLHVHDTEISRRELRDIGARRGMHESESGWWIEKEWEVVAIPERKRLFLFGGGLASKNAKTGLNA